jgi:hypothetical protein
MEKSPASLSPSLDQPSIKKALTNDSFSKHKIIKQAQASQSITSSSEDIIDYLNRIGHEYPFCVNNKQKINDPL